MLFATSQHFNTEDSGKEKQKRLGSALGYDNVHRFRTIPHPFLIQARALVEDKDRADALHMDTVACRLTGTDAGVARWGWLKFAPERSSIGNREGRQGLSMYP